MKVAFIRDEYDPYGGAENFLNLLTDKLATRGAEIHIFARKWPAGGQVRVHLRRISAPSSPSLLRHLVFMWRVGRKVRSGNFDIVQSYERLTGADIYRAGDGVHRRWLEIRLENVGFGKKVSIMANPFHRFMCNLEKRMYQDPGLKAVATNSHMVRDDIVSRFQIPPSHVRTIYNGVDLTRFNWENRAEKGWVARHSAGAKDGVPIVLFVGSGFERKGVASLLKASALLTGPFYLWIVGKGDAAKYGRIARKLGISEKVGFFGPRQDLEGIYAAADIFAFPTLYDPFPSVVLEAMASGLPVITTKDSGAAEIIRFGKDGFVIDSHRCVNELAAFIQGLFDNDLRRKMSENAAERAKCFSIESAVEQYEELYRHVAESRGPAAGRKS